MGPAAVAAPEVTFDGQEYRITWQGTRGGVRKVLSTRVSRLGGLAQGAELVLADAPASSYARRGGIGAVGPGRFLVTYLSYDATAARPRGQMQFVTEGPTRISYEATVNPWPIPSRQPAVAVGQGVYLVVWISTFDDYTQVLGIRVRASDGAVLDPAPILIGDSSRYHESTAVAFDGTNFLVLWGRGGVYSSSVTGRRVRASDGAVLDPYITLNTHGGLGTANGVPSVAFNGTNYGVTWFGTTRAADGSLIHGVMGRGVRPDGQFLQPADFMINPDSGWFPQVAYGGGRYLVVWSQNQELKGVRFDAASMTRLDYAPFSISAEAGFRPTVAANGDQFLVVWQGAGGLLKGARVRGSDGAVLPGAGFTVGGNVLAQAAVTFDGHDYRVAWQGSRDGARGLFSTRVSMEGTVVSGAELALSSIHPSTDPYGTQLASVAAVEPGRFLVVYQQYSGMDGIKMRLVEDVHSEVPCETGMPSLVLNGDAVMTLECGPRGYSDLGARAFDGCGNPIQVHAFNAGGDASGPGPLLQYEGSYTVSYAAWDTQGQTVNASRTVNVEDRTAPTLSLNGPAFMTHTCGSQWVDPGVQAMDACYGDISGWVWHTGEVNGWAEGTYRVTYTVMDSSGNSSPPVTRTVEVIDCPW